MRVERIYTRRIIAATPGMPIGKAAALMRKYHVGALLVTEDPSVEQVAAVGVITDRDIVVHAVARGLDMAGTTVGDVMTPAVATVARDADVHEALELMRAEGVRRLVVTDGTRAMGILSMDDVVDGIAADLSSLAGLVRAEAARERDEVEEEPEGPSAPVRIAVA
jgi:CBS domain-containing protein